MPVETTGHDNTHTPPKEEEDFQYRTSARGAHRTMKNFPRTEPPLGLSTNSTNVHGCLSDMVTSPRLRQPYRGPLLNTTTLSEKPRSHLIIFFFVESPRKHILVQESTPCAPAALPPQHSLAHEKHRLSRSSPVGDLLMMVVGRCVARTLYTLIAQPEG